MGKILVAQFLHHIGSSNLPKLKPLLEEDCLFINDEKSLLGKKKVIEYINELLNRRTIQHIFILNIVQEKKDTLLVSYHIIVDQSTRSIYGSAVVGFEGKRINYIKNFIVR